MAHLKQVIQMFQVKLTLKRMNPRGHLRFPLQKQQPVRGSSEVFDSSELISCLRNRAGHILDYQKLVVPHLLSKGLSFPSDIFSIFKKIINYRYIFLKNSSNCSSHKMFQKNW